MIKPNSPSLCMPSILALYVGSLAWWGMLTPACCCCQALVSLVSPEEAAELKQELQTLQEQLSEQQLLHQADSQAWQAERAQLQQQVDSAASTLAHTQQEAAAKVEQLQADADSQAAVMRHLTWQLEAAQQTLQQQQQIQHEQGPQQQREEDDSHSDGNRVTAVSALAAAEARASSAELQCHKLLELLVEEVQGLSQHSRVQQCITDELLEGTSRTLASLVRNSGCWLGGTSS